jgi:hypothetical protein
MSIYVRRAGRELLEPFKVPELTMDEAIRRGWELNDDDRLMVPKRDEEFLKTSPLWSQAVANWYFGSQVDATRFWVWDQRW